MTIVLEVEELGNVVRIVEVELGDDETVEGAAARLAESLGEIETEELLEDLIAEGERLERHRRLGELPATRWRHRRVCIDLHSEADQERHHFPARAKWARVHRWGCAKFHIPTDLCANLELREGSTTGPVLNEASEIGHFPGCKVVWLVKPGPEPYGGA